MQDKIYKGYETIVGSTDEINNIMGQPDFYDQFAVNQYLLIKNTDDGTTKEMRFDGASFVSLRLPPTKYIKGKNSLQRCALDLLNNPDIPIVSIMGGAGSGKSYLAMQMAKYAVLERGHQSKILCVRSPIAQGREVGYLKGTFEDKMSPFLLPFKQQLDGGEFEYEALRSRGVLDANIVFYMKGTTYTNTYMMIDEAEDLKDDEIVLVGTRVGENSRIIFNGDFKQSVFDRSPDNSLIRMCSMLRGNKLFGCIYLGEDVRSETSRIFADLFEDD